MRGRKTHVGNERVQPAGRSQPVLLFGMKIMGEGLERTAGNRLKNILNIVTHNRVLAVLAGMGITAVIQSSSATTVMVVGFVNAGLLSLTQAVGVIMGANIGTTVTSLMLSVKLDFGMIFACLGLALSILPQEAPPRPGPSGKCSWASAFLFAGMDTMSGAMEPLRDWQLFREAMTSINNPLLGVLIGAGNHRPFCSPSSASVGILQALAGEGLISLHASIYILFGQNIGTCVAALLASSGTNATAKRAAMVHLLFNVLGTILFMIISLTLPFADWVISLSPENMRLQIAIVHVIFNVTTTAVLLPLAKWLERRAACLLVRGKDGPRGEHAPEVLRQPPDEHAAHCRGAAVQGGAAHGRHRRRQLHRRHGLLPHLEMRKRAQEIMTNEDVLDFLNKEVTARLVEVKGLELSERDTRLVGSMFHVINDMERVEATTASTCWTPPGSRSRRTSSLPKRPPGSWRTSPPRWKASWQTAFEIFLAPERDTPRSWKRWSRWRRRAPTRPPKPCATTTWHRLENESVLRPQRHALPGYAHQPGAYRRPRGEHRHFRGQGSPVCHAVNAKDRKKKGERHHGENRFVYHQP